MSDKKTITINISTETPVAECDGTTYFSLAEAILAAKPGSTVNLLEDIHLDERLDIVQNVDIDMGFKVLNLDSEITFSGGCNCSFLNGFVVCNTGMPENILIERDSELALGDGSIVVIRTDNSILMTDGGLVFEGGVVVAEGCASPIAGDWSSGIALTRGAIVSTTGEPMNLEVGTRGCTGAAVLIGRPDKPVLLGCYAEEDGSYELVY